MPGIPGASGACIPGMCPGASGASGAEACIGGSSGAGSCIGAWGLTCTGAWGLTACTGGSRRRHVHWYGLRRNADGRR